MEMQNIKRLENTCLIFAFGLLCSEYFFINHYNTVKYMNEIDSKTMQDRYGTD